jgi:hypothetical protein
MSGDRGGTDVHRHTEYLFAQPRPQTHDLASIPYRHGHPELFFPQARLEAGKYAWVYPHPAECPLFLQGAKQAFEIPAGFFEARGLHFHVVKAKHRVELESVAFESLTYHLAVQLALRGHIDDAVALEDGMARETLIFVQGTTLGIAALGVRERA